MTATPHRTVPSLLIAISITMLLGCAAPSDELADAPDVSRRAMTSSTSPARPLLVRLQQMRRVATAPQMVVYGNWGTATGQFGRRLEASQPGPMRITIDRQGRILVLDQVNRRVQVFDAGGQLIRTVGPVEPTAEDLVATGDERIWVIAQPRAGEGERRLQLSEISFDGQRLQHGWLHRSAKLITGLFVSAEETAPDVWVELGHREQWRVVRKGRLLPPAEQVAANNRAEGRMPRRASDRVLARLLAAKTGPDRATVACRHCGGFGLQPLLDLACDHPLVQILELTTDTSGGLYVALALAPATPSGPLQRMMVVRPAAMQRGAVHHGADMLLDLVGGPMATDSFRPLAVAPDGSIYQMHTTGDGVRIWRWAAPTARLEASP